VKGIDEGVLLHASAGTSEGLGIIGTDSIDPRAVHIWVVRGHFKTIKEYALADGNFACVPGSRSESTINR